MKFFYCSFNEYRYFSDEIKSKYLFLNTAKTHPAYFQGYDFKPFIPSDKLFFDACKDFKNSNFEQRYFNQINSLSFKGIINALEQFGQDIIVFLVWEAENKPSERDIFIPWLYNCEVKDISAFSFTTYLKNQQTLNNSNIFNL